MQLHQLLEQNRSNHFKLLILVDNSQQKDAIIERLQQEGWICYDVGDEIQKIIQDMPEDEIQVGIAGKIKDWAVNLPEKVILYNTNILHSPEFGDINPVSVFRYRSRVRQIVLFVEGNLHGDHLIYSEYGRADNADIDVREFITAKVDEIDD